MIVEWQEGSGVKGKTVTNNPDVTKEVMKKRKKNPRPVPSSSQTVTDNPDVTKKD